MVRPTMANSLSVQNPYSGKKIADLPFDSTEDISKKLSCASEAFGVWKHSTSFQRSELLNHVAQLMDDRRTEFEMLICHEAGKPIQFAKAEVSRALGVLRWAAGETQRFSGELLRIDTTGTGRSGYGLHTRFPRGIILGITPFNFPLNLTLHKVAPAIASGNVILIKPSPSAPLSALKLAELFLEVRPDVPGLVQVTLAEDQATEKLTRAPEISMISFTGSARVGSLVRRQSPEKPMALELGGNAWVVVMEDASASDFPKIVKRITNGAYGYAGQSCISVQNVAIAENHFRSFSKLLSEATHQTAFGDPENPEVISGPVINAGSARRIEAELARAPKNSHRVQSSLRSGSSESPTLVPPSLVVFKDEISEIPAVPLIQEEIFGPVMTAARFQNIDGLISRINSSRYGLQTGVFTQNWMAIEKLYQELQVGGLVVNDAPTSRYDHQPYGGVKESGQGREGIRYAMEEMTESKFLALSSRIP